MSAKLYSGNNTHTVSVDGLADESTGDFINDATATVTIYKCDSETEVEGVEWPVSLTASGSNGEYSATFNAYDSLEAGSKYTIKVNIESGGNYSEFERSVMAERRRF